MGITGIILDAGVPTETLILLLSLPIIATLATISRNVIGLKAFRIFIPVITTYAFLGLGIKYATAISLCVIVVSLIARWIIRKSRIQYFSRMVLVLSFVSFAVLGALFLAAEFNFDSIISRPVFPVILIIALGEEYVDTLIKKDARSATVLYIETVALSILGYFLISWDSYQKFILDWPIITLGAILIALIIGKWKGLRLVERYKFRKVASAEAEREEERQKARAKRRKKKAKK